MQPNIGKIEKLVTDYLKPKPNLKYSFKDIENVLKSLFPIHSLNIFEEKDSFCLYLNPYYEACPAPSTSGSGNSIKNFDLLVDIMAQTYLMLFMRLSDDDLRATKKNINLNTNSICSILNRFIENCEDCKGLQWESPEKLLRSLQLNLRVLIQEDSND